MCRLFFLFIIFVFISLKGFSQCCTANPVAGSVNIGVLTKNTFRSISYYRYSYSDTYFNGSEKSNLNFLKYSYYNFAGTLWSYGITNRLTADLQLGYYINRTEIFNTDPVYTQKGWGFSNGVASLKYAFTKKGTFELTGGLGLKFPFTQQQLTIDGVQLPQTAQPSTGAFGAVIQVFMQKAYLEKGLRFFLIHRTEINGTNTVYYRTGNSYSTAFYISKSINYRWTAIVQIRNENRAKDIRDNERIPISGGYELFFSPQINYSVTQKLNVSILADFPVYKYYNGTQLASKYAFVVSLTKDFDFNRNK